MVPIQDTGVHSRVIIQVLQILIMTTSLTVMARYNATILTIEIESSPFFSFDLRRSAPAVQLAVKEAQKLYNDTLELHWIHRPGACGPEMVAAQAANAYYTSGFDVFIGPGCSKAVEVVAHMANSWNLPIMTPVGNTGSISNKTVFPRLTRLSIFMQSQFVDMVLLLMKQYGWKHMVIFNDESSIFHDLTGITFKSVLEEFVSDGQVQDEVKWARYAIFSKTMTRHDYTTLLIGVKPLARVIVILAQSEASREFMLAAHALGYTSGEFAFFALTNPASKVDETIWKRNDNEDEAARQAYESVIFLQLAVDLITGDAEFQELMINASLQQYNYSYARDNRTPSSSVLRYYEAVMIYAAVLNETVTLGEDPKDGLAVTQRMWNRTFQGRRSHLVINEVGDRSSDIAIVDLNPDTGVPEIVSVYRSDKRQIEVLISRGIVWPYGKGPPLDIPICGFVDEKCDFTDFDQTVITAVSVVFAVLVLVGLVVFTLLFRRWRRISKANLWWWRIAPDQLQVHSLPMTGSLASVQSGLNQTSGKSHPDLNTTSVVFDMAVFKGQLVRLRKLDIRKPNVSGAVLRDFKLLRELVAPNLVRVFGACLDGHSPLLVTELCPKGSLQDLLGSGDFSLDTEFKISLANDIVDGLCYLHGCPVGYHGGLNSSTCLIDNRFTVKLTDFCVSSLLAQELVDTTGQEYKRECLWKAPELLRAPGVRPGSKEGDIYSFGIILSELITRASPYEKELDCLTLDEILDRVKQGGNPEGCFRPSVETPSSLQGFCELMTSSWCEDPRQRPPAASLKKRIKALTIKFGKSANLLDNLLRRMELYANNLEKLVEEKTAALAEEKKKTEQLLYEILPQSIAQRLVMGLSVPPEQFDCVTIYFSDIVGFTTLSSLSTPIQVVDLLNDLYSAFDETLVAFDVYKVETIGDAYMVVSGLPQPNGNKHAQQIARMSLAIRNVISAFQVRHRPGEKLQLRIGLNSGPVCAGVVGVKMPRYCLFGDTVNTASRMESNGEGMKIHMSESTTEILQNFDTFNILPRGNIEIKGKGSMTTYWLIGETPCPAIQDGQPSSSSSEA